MNKECREEILHKLKNIAQKMHSIKHVDEIKINLYKSIIGEIDKIWEIIEEDNGMKRG